MPPQISVILCTHNPRSSYFFRVLDALRRQTLPRDQWELLIVDNASAESLKDAWSLAWHPHGRFVREQQLGIIYARIRGIREASSQMLLFVDDDNVLSENYLEYARALFAAHPYLGVFGAGRLDPDYETTPPPELAPYLSMLAIRSIPEPRWTNNIQDTALIPWGAGLCVRRHIAEAFADFAERLGCIDFLGRRGQRLFCGEDDLFSHIAIERGFGFGIFPELQLTHLIRASRLTHTYFLQLLEGHSFSHEIIGHVLKKKSASLDSSIMRDFAHSLRCAWFEFRCRRAGINGIRNAHRIIGTQ